ncbi:MAG TPA: hypothetical protein VM029_21040 [Opitutaceae bacterium]|nr:hypothetical protein [Opitutaceae bacterium]
MNNDKDLNKALKKDKSRNPDPITGAPGSHPVGTGIGAALGGAAAAGAIAGSAVGPVGTVAGAAVGAVVGGLMGKGVAEKIDPTREDAYWRDNHARQGWAKGRSYDEFSPAYRVGYEGYGEYGKSGKTFDESEAELRRRYEASKPKLSWDEARPASRAAWQKFDTKNPPNSSVDTYGNPRPM